MEETEKQYGREGEFHLASLGLGVAGRVVGDLNGPRLAWEASAWGQRRRRNAWGSRRPVSPGSRPGLRSAAPEGRKATLIFLGKVL
ncbi:hypothetical protein FRUB_06212 [Fimbriiglobus ruber]|uniref:Uncharacterized protein n=1 Tax=Fimbriiglobus ruber TaxID=1908690 RepID=A0A225DC11_9BACT|nr:hypothetical protein FRUB_06212 [Fimbriiglobus ruber]